MPIELEPNQTILIKTYLHESGLFYLAKTLGDLLKSQGHKVIYLPKSKYLLRGSIFNRTYLKPTDENLLDGEAVHWCDERRPVDKQVLNAINKFEADLLISFETLMEKSQWIYKVKHNTKIKVIDVPMIEWVTPRLLSGKSYVIFDEIWCLTDQCKEFFKDYPQAKRISWDFVDRDLFHPVEKEQGAVHFYHAASLNPEYSTKNTDLVIKAFDRFMRDEPEATLTISGLVTKSESKQIVQKHNNIHVIDEVLDRNALAAIYRKSHCVLAPSSREGLGLSLYEAEACDCLVVTTDIAPMNEGSTKYLCRTTGIKRDQKLVPLGILEAKDICDQIKRAYGDIKCQKSE